MTAFTPFHSAVNRIPVLRESACKLASRGVFPSDLFCDGRASSDKRAVGHDHLDPKRWSGSIDLEMTVRTPLVFGEQTTTGEGRDERHFVDLPLDDDDNLVIPPTMVKGMVSRAFETLTCSRFRVFGGVADAAEPHSELLTYRADPAAANELVPGRVCEGSDGGLAVEILDGFGGQSRVALIRDELNRGYGRIVCSEHPAIKAGPGGRIRPEQVLARFRKIAQHGEEIEVRLTRWKDRSGCQHLMVTGVWNSDRLEVFFDVADGVDVRTFDVWGYPCRTSPDGKSSRQLFKEKTYERFFFKSSYDGRSLEGVVLPLDPDHLYRYATVLRSYRDQRTVPGGGKHLLNRAAATISNSSDVSLSVGDLVFVRLENKIASTDTVITEDAQVKDVLPTMVGRRSYSRSPYGVAQAQNVLPLKSRDQASAADRVFGYVVSSSEEDLIGGGAAARGHLFFGAVDASGARIEKEKKEEKELVPLLAPKPASARRFLTDASGRTPRRQDGGPLARGEYFAKGQCLGAAAYPVHRQLLDRPGFPPSAITAYAEPGVDQSNESVRLHARSWVRTGSVLRCTLSFTDLSRAELGALIWVLTPENLVPAAEKQADAAAVGYLRMGLGKPLGLGVLEVRIAADGLRATCGADLAKKYENISACLGSCSTTVVDPKEFRLPCEKNILQTPWVQAMQRAAFGYSDRVPVRYMLLEENKANNLTDSKTGMPKSGYGQAPDDLSANEPEPTHIKGPNPTRPRGNQNRGRHGGRR